MILLDKIIIAILCLFFLSGWLSGFLKSLIGPIAFLFCFISAVIFYDLNHNILIAVLIATAGTIALTITFDALLAMTLAAISKDFRGKTFLVSRIFGSIITVLWQSNFLFAFIILFSVLPIKNEKLENLQNQIPHSKITAYYSKKVINPNNSLKAIVMSLSSLRDPNEMEKISSTTEYKAFYSHPKVQKFINDPQVIDALAAKNFLHLLTSPSLKELVIDDDAMACLTAIAGMVYEKNLEKLTGVPEK